MILFHFVTPLSDFSMLFEKILISMLNRMLFWLSKAATKQDELEGQNLRFLTLSKTGRFLFVMLLCGDDFWALEHPGRAFLRPQMAFPNLPIHVIDSWSCGAFQADLKFSNEIKQHQMHHAVDVHPGHANSFTLTTPPPTHREIHA